MYTKEMAIEDGGHEITTRINCSDGLVDIPIGFIDTNFEVAKKGTEVVSEISWHHLYDLNSVTTVVQEGYDSPESCELHIDREKHCAKFTFIMPDNDIQIIGSFKRKEK